VLIVDLGRLSEEVYRWLEQFQDHHKIIFLTHEHFDHHYDVNKLSLLKNTSVNLCSKAFQEALKCSRKNLSYYYNIPFETTIDNVSNFNYFETIETPGHSKFSVCFYYKNIIFGGDTVIDKKYLVLKLPGSNKIDFKNSITKIKDITAKNTIVLPGHGDLFFLNI
jgi:glyoxylase-like metal-dependent hydrolase (beta-lactamase superfamily II)